MASRRTKIWRGLFFGLLGLNVFLFAIFVILVFVPNDSDQEAFSQEELSQEEEPGAEFTINTSKQNLNELINAYIDLLLEDQSDQYSVRLEEDVQLYGSVEAFGANIPVTIRMEPVVQENGDLILHQKNISLGLLYLPNNKVLEYVEKRFDMPEFIHVNPDEENIYVAITEMELRSNFNVAVEDFNLPENDLSFRIKIPYETLGL